MWAIFTWHLFLETFFYLIGIFLGISFLYLILDILISYNLIIFVLIGAFRINDAFAGLIDLLSLFACLAGLDLLDEVFLWLILFARDFHVVADLNLIFLLVYCDGGFRRRWL